MISLEGLYVNDTANIDGKWIINENVEFVYSSGVDFKPLNTNINVTSDQIDKIIPYHHFKLPFIHPLMYKVITKE